MPAAHLLVVEDRESLRKLLDRALAAEGYQVVTAADGAEAIAILGRQPFDLVLTDLKLPGASGLEVLAAARAAQPPVATLVMTAYGTVAAAVEAMKLGAIDFLEKPVEIEQLLRLVAAALGERREEPSFRAPGVAPIVGRHPRLRAALRLLERVAPTDSTVLLLGESGTGKELFARSLHALSPRAGGPFVAVNCAAIPETLIENELFGHERGAFTGADRRQAGRFEQAEGGTLLLDEIGELPLAVQGKVLRVLEERTFERIGGAQTLHANLRLVAATNRDLRQMVAEGEFRADLFFRLDVFPIELPALRERPTDIALLARHLAQGAGERQGRTAPAIADDALALLAEQSWPGNVRQLANLLERAMILVEGPTLRASDLRPLLVAAEGGERERLRAALVETGGDKRAAAERLGMSYRTLLRKVREHDLSGVPKYRE